MKHAINILLKEESLIIDRLKKNSNNRTENVSKISEIKKAIKWLSKIDELRMREVKNYQILKLPDMSTGWPSFRIMNDYETDDREKWIEFKEYIGLMEGTLLSVLNLNKGIQRQFVCQL